MMKIILVGTGGFFGSALRYIISTLMHKIFAHPYPIGTLTVNIAGCLLIGILAGLADSKNILGPQTRLFLLVGFLGGFTTFSSFASETCNLLNTGQHFACLSNVAISVTLGIAAVLLGTQISQLL